MGEDKAEIEKRHYIKISRSKCEGDKTRIAKPKATRNVRTEALSETSVADLRKNPSTLLKRGLHEALRMPYSQ